MKFTGTSNDVLTRFFNGDGYQRIRFGQTFQTFYQFWQVRWVLWLNSDTDDSGDGELHHTHVVGGVSISNGSRLEDELINTNKTDCVTSRYIRDRFYVTAHHENSTLDVLDEHIALRTRLVVRSLNSDLLSRFYSSREDTSESVETTFIIGRYHLGYVQYERSCRVAVSDTLTSSVISRSSVKCVDTVLLGLYWGWQVNDQHL
mmetsp:Transcript_1007/g.1146  ORF Transcript_1007/g.1146 Transcript_1007/m.1146 type:complete len:203 (-) Transcript_1007:1053-1661(-)